MGLAAFGLEELEGRPALPPEGRDVSGVSFVFFNAGRKESEMR